MTFTVTLSAMKALAKQASHGRAAWAETHITALGQALWRKKLPPGAAIEFAQVREILGVEIALWSLPAAQSDYPARSIDRAGRLIACTLVIPVFENWLPETILLSDAQTGPGFVTDLARDIIDERRPLTDWHGWMLDLEALLEGVDRSYSGCILEAALRASKSVMVRSLTERRDLPSKRKLAAQGRYCAWSAYFDAAWAWSVSTVGYKAAHEIMDMAVAAGVDGEALVEIKDCLDDLNNKLIERSDAVIQPYANFAFDQYIVKAR